MLEYHLGFGLGKVCHFPSPTYSPLSGLSTPLGNILDLAYLHGSYRDDLVVKPWVGHDCEWDFQ